jgi:hypothetical protein
VLRNLGGGANRRWNRSWWNRYWQRRNRGFRNFGSSHSVGAAHRQYRSGSNGEHHTTSDEQHNSAPYWLDAIDSARFESNQSERRHLEHSGRNESGRDTRVESVEPKHWDDAK